MSESKQDAWRLGLRDVRGLVAAEPDHEARSYWKIRERIFEYLLKRYTDSRDQPVEDAPVSTRAVITRYVPAAMPMRTEVDPSVVEGIRGHVRNIASANLEVDKTPPPIVLPKPRPHPPNLPEKQLSRAQWRWLFVYLPLLVILGVVHLVSLIEPAWIFAGFAYLAFVTAVFAALALTLMAIAPFVLLMDRWQERKQKRRDH